MNTDLITLSEALKHLRISEEDDYQEALYNDISLKISAVSEIILTYCNLDLQSYQDSSGVIDSEIPKTLKAASLVYLGILFNNRNGESEETLQLLEIPRSVSNILSLYRKPGLA